MAGLEKKKEKKDMGSSLRLRSQYHLYPFKSWKFNVIHARQKYQTCAHMHMISCKENECEDGSGGLVATSRGVPYSLWCTMYVAGSVYL